MAGLGTGAAPFRAFLQHRALLATQGVPLGPVYYYFGSRHQSQEYLYGEEVSHRITLSSHDVNHITIRGSELLRDAESKLSKTKNCQLISLLRSYYRSLQN